MKVYENLNKTNNRLFKKGVQTFAEMVFSRRFIFGRNVEDPGKRFATYCRTKIWHRYGKRSGSLTIALLAMNFKCC
jgi:hypothetical protein